VFRKFQDDRVNRYIRERVKQARLEAKETQGDLAKVLEKKSCSCIRFRTRESIR
jgi:DNA-binding XRE family transcriptional regulator